MSRHRKQRIKLKSVYVWHRYIGLTAAALVILLAMTGIALTHTEQLKLDHHFVHNSWLLDWYGISAPRNYRAYATRQGTVTLLDSQLYIGHEIVTGEYHQLNGAIAMNDMLVVAVDSGLLLVSAEGEIIEHLTETDGIPTDIKRIGLSTANQPVIATQSGLFSTNADFLSWTHIQQSSDQTTWSQTIQLDDTERELLAQRSRENILPYERVLLDLHSGRLFGRYGPQVMDGAALLMLFLAGSGVFIWLKRKH